jgi:hypothetical protein
MFRTDLLSIIRSLNTVYTAIILDDWLTVHHSITLVDAQNSCLFTYNTLLQSSTCFEKSFLSTGAQDSHLQRVTIPEAAYIQLRRRPPEDEQGNARNI